MTQIKPHLTQMGSIFDPKCWLSSLVIQEFLESTIFNCDWLSLMKKNIVTSWRFILKISIWVPCLGLTGGILIQCITLEGTSMTFIFAAWLFTLKMPFWGWQVSPAIVFSWTIPFKHSTSVDFCKFCRIFLQFRLISPYHFFLIFITSYLPIFAFTSVRQTCLDFSPSILQ